MENDRMRARRRSLPRGARAAGRIVKVLGAFGSVNLFLVCLLISFASCGAKVADESSGNTACELPSSVGGKGVEMFGDSTLTGLAGKLPAKLAGGDVHADVKAGRTAQQGVNALNALPDSAPNVFVISLAADDHSSAGAYTARIDELMLLLSGRSVYWVTAPGKDAYTTIVNRENAADPSDPEAQSGWQIVDFAAAVKQNPSWRSNGKPTAAGLTNLAQTVGAYLGAFNTTGSPTFPGGGPLGPIVPPLASSPGATSGVITVTSTTSGQSFPLDGERLTNAKTIVSVGGALGMPQRALVIAMATAIQESNLINLKGGPGGAYGLFQQTPPAWGSVAQVTSPGHAATSFYQHLQKIKGWQNMALTDAAQAVQRSAYPDAYAQWEQSASVIVAALTGQHVAGCGPQVSVPGNPKAQIAVNAALSQLGVPYSFAGGNTDGPTLGRCVAGTDGWNDCHIVGFDCSGLMLYAWGKAGVTVPHFTGAMWTDPSFTHITDKSQLQPGDMMMFEGNPPGHTGMYIGDGKLVDAPHSGTVVKIESVNDPWYRSGYIGALRPKV
jgi:cell wall-associated NlpC family hydrolase